MIAICCATTDEIAFRAAGAATVESLDDGSSLLLRRHAGNSAVHCNEMLAVAGKRDDLEAVVLVHQDTVVELDAHPLARIRGLLAGDSDIAVVGAIDQEPPRELATVDGTLVALSPWAARSLRFDIALGGSVDACARDLSLQARAAGRRVVGAPLGLDRISPPRPTREERRVQLHAIAQLNLKWDVEVAG